MIAQQELIRKVKHFFGLNIYESKVWLALLGRNIASAGEIAEMSGVPRSRTYDVLESLEKRGFAIPKLGKPIKYMAVKPTSVLEKLKSKIIYDAKEKVTNLSSLKETQEYEQLVSLHNSTDKPIRQGDISGALRGRVNLYEHAREMLGNAEKEVIIATSVLEIESKLRTYSKLFNNLNKAGVSIKLCLRGNEKEIQGINERFNVKAKKSDFEGKFFVADKKEMLFVISNSPDEEEIGIWIRSDFFASAFSTMFNLAFKNNNSIKNNVKEKNNKISKNSKNHKRK